MSEILIKVARDEEIDRCGRCPCFHHEYPMYCQAIKGDRHKKIVRPYASPRPDWCPLAELPEKHGGLIDRDALIAEWKDVLSTDGISPMFAMVLEGAIRDVERAKVIVEAESDNADNNR